MRLRGSQRSERLAQCSPERPIIRRGRWARKSVWTVALPWWSTVGSPSWCDVAALGTVLASVRVTAGESRQRLIALLVRR